MVKLRLVFHAKLALLVLVLTHWVACAWFFVGRVCLDQTNWIAVDHIDTAHVWTQYARSIYFSITSLSTETYGDITATNIYETMAMFGVIIVAAAIFAGLPGTYIYMEYN